MQAIIRYRIKPDQVERNVELLRAVYEELETLQPQGLRWSTFRCEDGVTFVAFVEGDDLPGPLSQLSSFQRYRATLDERCDEPLVMTELHEVGSFGFN